MCAQSVSSAGARAGVARGDRGLERVRTRPAAEALRLLERVKAAADQEPIPARAILVEEQDRCTGGIEPGARPGSDWISMSATRPCTSGSFGVSAASMRPSRSASSHSSGRIQSSPDVAE